MSNFNEEICVEKEDFKESENLASAIIIRSSTRLAEFSDGEMSDYYRGKIIPTDEAMKILNIDIPDSFEFMGRIYHKSPNGYIKDEFHRIRKEPGRKGRICKNDRINHNFPKKL